jgi:hypothetical protein
LYNVELNSSQLKETGHEPAILVEKVVIASLRHFRLLRELSAPTKIFTGKGFADEVSGEHAHGKPLAEMKWVFAMCFPARQISELM